MQNDKAKLKFLFGMCNSVQEIAHFYGQTLGLMVSTDDSDVWCSVDLGIDFIFFKGDYDLPVQSEWAWQPGYKSGPGHFFSWSIEYSDEKSYRQVISRLISDRVPTLGPKPEWRRDSYWGYTAKDPMGNTIEIYWAPSEKPDSLTWQ